MNEFQKHLFKLNEVKFSDYNLHYLNDNNEAEEGMIVVITKDFEKAFDKKATKNRKLYNGGIKCYYYQYFGDRKNGYKH